MQKFEFEPHQNGMYAVLGGSILNKYTGCLIEEPATLLDINTGTVLKMGEKEYVERYMRKAFDNFRKTGFPENADALALITYDKYKSLTADQICTLMNYLANSLEPERVQEILSASWETMTQELNKLYEIGW